MKGEAPPAAPYALGALYAATEALWWRLERLESALLRDDIEARPIDRPVYVAGLARSGSTLLLELLAAAPGVACHCYRDFPFLAVPWFWDRAGAGRELRHAPARERFHGDGLMVTPDSPEAMEEMIWQRFFGPAAGGDGGDLLDERTRNPRFERVYRDHIRKLLMARSGGRYLAKANYNLSRLGYLHRLFPDARFVVPVREPVAHVASLMRQQERFAAAASRDPRARRHLRLVGHFEFGPDRRAVRSGDAAAEAAIAEAWRAGDEVGGWCRYWTLVHDRLLHTLERAAGVAAASLVVPLGRLRRDPRRVLAEVLDHCGLQVPDLGDLARRVRPEAADRRPLSAADAARVEAATGATWARLQALAPTL